jgi:4-amino-4-deoxy-L-arabinose transferase-like glycosyltransferase
MSEERWLFWLAAACFAFSRLYNLKGLPIFIDEAADIQVAITIWRSDVWHALNGQVAVGKFLHVLLYSLTSSWAPDVLLAARLVSAAAGAVTFVCCYRIGTRLFGVQVGLVAAALYTVCPFGLFYDRIALSDTILCATAACTIAATVALLDEPSTFRGFVLGAAMALAALAKITGLVVFLIPPFACVFLRGTRWPARGRRRALFLAYGLSLLVVGSIYGAAYMFGSRKPLSGNAHLTVFAGRLQDYWAELGERVPVAAEWITDYATTSFIGAALVAFVVACKAADRKVLFLASVCAILIGCPLLVTRIIFPRYFVWVSSPLLVCIAVLIVQTSQAVTARLKFGRIAGAGTTAALLLLVSVQACSLDYGFIVDCSKAELPPVDREQYVEGWPSGYGVREAAQFVIAEAKQTLGGIYVVCPEFGSNSHFGLRPLLARDQAITIEHSPLRGDAEFAQLRQWRSERPVYVVFERPPVSGKPEEQLDLARLETGATEVKIFRKPGDRTSLVVYRVAR